METQFKVMLDMQHRMNTRVHPDWINQQFAWHRALWIECGELIDHYGFKWWKKQVPDMEQVRLEIVDIWHFGMSMLFDRRDTASIAADLCREIAAGDVPQRTVLEAAEELATTTLSTRKFSILDFTALLRSADMDYDALYTAYISKNVLNFFRQDHGYKEGTYHKNWQGREDNEHLVELLGEIDSGALDFADRIYAALARRYAEMSPTPL